MWFIKLRTKKSVTFQNLVNIVRKEAKKALCNNVQGHFTTCSVVARPQLHLPNTLIGTLIKLREEEIAIMVDIDSMIYQVSVPLRDASFLDFYGGKMVILPIAY